MKKICCICVVLSIFFAGCTRVVDSYIDFSIVEFDEFNSLITKTDEEQFIVEGRLDVAKVNDVVIVPYIKQTSYTECTLLVYAYSLDDNNSVFVNRAVLSASNGQALCCKENINIAIEMNLQTQTMLSGVTIIDVFNIDEDWFYNGNQLSLSIDITVKDNVSDVSGEMNYLVNLVGHKSLLMPT